MSKLHDAVELTANLVKINSENPMNTEEKITDYISNWLLKESIEFELQRVTDKRRNIIARVPGKNLRDPIVIIAHCDTVPIGAGWTHDPLSGEIVDGKLYGRGSADMKGGLAASLYALKEVNSMLEIPGDFIVIVSVDEEGPGMLGVMEILKTDIIKKNTMVISPEPTSLDIIRAHRGVMWYEITAYGKSSHGGHADRGVDANHALSEVICELKSTVASLKFDENPLLSIGKMAGGEKTNVVPDKAKAEVDFRIELPMSAEDANALIENTSKKAIKKVPGARVEVQNLGLQRSPVETPSNAPIVKILDDCFKVIMKKEPNQGKYVAYTDAAVVALKLDNKNSVCFGPGSLEQAHKPDEWIDIKEIELCGEIFKLLATSK